jgi:hypothetical protein
MLLICLPQERPLFHCRSGSLLKVWPYKKGTTLSGNKLFKPVKRWNIRQHCYHNNTKILLSFCLNFSGHEIKYYRLIMPPLQLCTLPLTYFNRHIVVRIRGYHFSEREINCINHNIRQ